MSVKFGVTAEQTSYLSRYLWTLLWPLKRANPTRLPVAQRPSFFRHKLQLHIPRQMGHDQVYKGEVQVMGGWKLDVSFLEGRVPWSHFQISSLCWLWEWTHCFMWSRKWLGECSANNSPLQIFPNVAYVTNQLHECAHYGHPMLWKVCVCFLHVWFP